MSDRAGVDQLGEALEGAVVSLFHIVRKAAGRQLPHGEVVAEAVAAHTLAGAPAVSAMTVSQIFVFLAFHDFLFP